MSRISSLRSIGAIVAAVAAILALGAESVRAISTPLWRVGIDNGTQSEFGQESGGSNVPPGSAAIKDDDWYHAGTYPGPIGTLASRENFSNFERALTNGDVTDRIHFNLAPTQLDDDFTINIDVISSNFTGGNIPFSVLFNGSLVHAESVGANGLRTTATFNGATVGAITGDNIITLTRGAGGNWMQFDYVQLNVDPVGEPDFTTLWQLGTDNGSQADFAQENGSSNPPPGQAGIRDDDWYFAGNYSIGNVPADDPLNTFERALTNGDRTNRIHFNLTNDQLNDNFLLEFDLIASSFTGGSIPLHVLFNGVPIYDEVVTFDDLRRSLVFNGMSVGAVAGENVITFTRDAGGNWTQFDFIRLNIQSLPVPEPATATLGLLALGALMRRRRAA